MYVFISSCTPLSDHYLPHNKNEFTRIQLPENIFLIVFWKTVLNCFEHNALDCKPTPAGIYKVRQSVSGKDSSLSCYIKQVALPLIYEFT